MRLFSIILLSAMITGCAGGGTKLELSFGKVIGPYLPHFVLEIQWNGNETLEKQDSLNTSVNTAADTQTPTQ